MSLTSIETAVIDAHRAGETASPQAGSNTADWVAFGLEILLHAGRLARESRSALGGDVEIKTDGSPVTQVEKAIEGRLAERLAEVRPDAVMVGEESGGELPGSGLAVAIDPIDGTWAYLGGTETYASTLTFFRDGEAFLGMVGSPVAGEVGYAAVGEGARLVRLSLFGEPDAGFDLPEDRQGSSLLVNVHPSRAGGPAVRALYDGWVAGRVHMVRSPGGSPAWGMLEAARGRFVYANMWSQKPAEPYDLAPGTLLVRGAGGEVIDLNGRPIDATRHRGPFVAGIDPEAREEIVALVSSSLSP